MKNNFFSLNKSVANRFKRQASQMLMWLLLFCTLLVLAMTPIFSANKKVSLNAGQTGSGTQYDSAPWVQVNSANALFTGGSSLDGNTIYDLLAQINSTAVWNGVTATGKDNVYLSAKNFGKLDSTNNAQLLVTLFNGATLDAITTTNNSNLDISNASKMQWQVVYRSMSNTETKDVLTLYMNHTSATGVYYDNTSPYYGYYKDSNLREVAKGTYTALVGKYSALDNYVVLPNALPGLWQSSAYQTGSDKTQSSYTSGASKAYGGASYDAINNGMDTKGTLHSSWSSTSTTTTDPYSNDKLWVPSNYEVIYKDNTTDGATSYVSDATSASATLTNGTTGGTDGENDGRTGLWELNGYDRASNSWAWLRSGYSYGSNYARDVHFVW